MAEGFQESQVITCPVCRKAAVEDGLTSILLERDGVRITIQRVPAFVCPACGEAYLAEGVTARVLSTAVQMFDDKIDGSIQVFS